MLDRSSDWGIPEAIIDEWLDEAAPSLVHMIIGATSVIDFPQVLIDGNMPASLRERVVDRVARSMSEMNLSGLVAPEISAGSLGAKARSLGAASLPLSKRFLLET